MNETLPTYNNFYTSNEEIKGSNETKSELGTLKIETKENETIRINLEKSLKNIRSIEYDYLISYISTNNKTNENISDHDIYEFTLKVQKDNGLAIDGIIGPKTLKVLYIEYYSKINDSLPEAQKQRLRMLEEMNKYYDHPRLGTIYPSGIPKIFNTKYYYGELNSQNIEGTYIDSTLSYGLPEISADNSSGLYSVAQKISGKSTLAIYLHGKLMLATYTSLGNNHIVDGILTPIKDNLKGVGIDGDKYHISAAESSRKIRNGKDTGAIMPNAIHVGGLKQQGIFIHAGKVNGERRSHGCIRVPFFYSDAIWGLVRDYGDLKLDIKDN